MSEPEPYRGLLDAALTQARREGGAEGFARAKEKLRHAVALALGGYPQREEQDVLAAFDAVEDD